METDLQELNDSFVRYCHTDTEAFLSDINRSLSSSRRVFQQLERKHVSEPRENDWERIQSQVRNTMHSAEPEATSIIKQGPLKISNPSLIPPTLSSLLSLHPFQL